MGSQLGQLLDVAYNIEYGAESSVQSSLNLIYLLGYLGPGQLRVFGKSDEKYHVRGGNDQIASRPRRCARRPDHDRLGARLRQEDANRRIHARAQARHEDEDGRGRRARARAARSRSCGAPSTWPSRVSPRASCRQSPSSEWERTRSSTSSSRAATGAASARPGRRTRTGATRARGRSPAPSPVKSGLLVDYTGGTIGSSFGSGTPTSRGRSSSSRQIEPVLPGHLAVLEREGDRSTSGRATRGRSAPTPTGRSASTPPSPAIEGRQEGRAHFCGEHTSVDFQGYLNGAVDTGERAAGEVVGDLRIARGRG